jgi:hypothetical protein
MFGRAVKSARGPTDDELPVEDDVAGELVGDRGDDLGEVASEGPVLAGVQPYPTSVRGRDCPEPVELRLNGTIPSADELYDITIAVTQDLNWGPEQLREIREQAEANARTYRALASLIDGTRASTSPSEPARTSLAPRRQARRR